MSDLTGSEIREAVAHFDTWLFEFGTAPTDPITDDKRRIVNGSALAYADVLEKAEKRWYCAENKWLDEKPNAVCSVKHRYYGANCRWVWVIEEQPTRVRGEQ